MNSWGTRIHDAVTDISQMLAVGLGLPKNTFSDMAKYGPHLLAPTGSDLKEYGAIDTVLAGNNVEPFILTISTQVDSMFYFSVYNCTGISFSRIHSSPFFLHPPMKCLFPYFNLFANRGVANSPSS